MPSTAALSSRVQALRHPVLLHLHHHLLPLPPQPKFVFHRLHELVPADSGNRIQKRLCVGLSHRDDKNEKSRLTLERPRSHEEPRPPEVCVPP
jgi:hypothetical protein